jgi:hypothetical protein
MFVVVVIVSGYEYPSAVFGPFDSKLEAETYLNNEWGCKRVADLSGAWFMSRSDERVYYEGTGNKAFLREIQKPL